ncbi:MAG TPA: STAS domain-containing protein [Acidimicrobiales bacterium]|nr:STAS domain-containing protein [Acidimicrobiales bacterium]
MDLSMSIDDGSATLRVAGEVDAHNCDQLSAAVDAAGAGALRHLVVDASELEFIDSSGISALLALRERVTDHGGEFELRDPTPAVRRVIEITGLLDTFGVA